MRKKIIISSVCFVFLFISVSFCLSKIITNESDLIQRDILNSFYKEKKNSLDVVIIGPSSTFCAWIPLVVWHKYGITNLTYSSPGLPHYALKNIIKEILSIQKPKLLIINIDGIAEFPAYDDGTCVDIQRYLLNMPFSMNKIEVINSVIDGYNLSFIKSLEFYFPIIRFHQNWKNLKKTILKKIHTKTYRKGIFTQINYEYYTLEQKKDFSEKIPYTRSPYNVPKDYYDYLRDLYSFLTSLDVHVLLINTPLYSHRENEDIYNRHESYFDAAFKTAKEYNLDCIDFRDKRSSLFAKSDYFDPGHLNYKGALKFMNYLANIIQTKYNLVDNRNNNDYSDWNDAYTEYVFLTKEVHGIDIKEAE